MTRKPETAPPRRATVSASPRLAGAPAAVRMLLRTATYMPMKPAETGERGAEQERDAR